MGLYQVVIQFRVGDVTIKGTKFKSLVAQLKSCYTENACDIVNGSMNNRYSAVEKRMFRYFTKNENEKK